jgi:hypothetical protein
MTLQEMYDKVVLQMAEPEVQALRKRLRQDSLYLRKHIDEWRSTLPDHWVVVQGQTIVLAETTSVALFRAAEEKGVSLAESQVTFVAKERPILVL